MEQKTAASGRNDHCGHLFADYRGIDSDSDKGKYEKTGNRGPAG